MKRLSDGPHHIFTSGYKSKPFLSSCYWKDDLLQTIRFSPDGNITHCMAEKHISTDNSDKSSQQMACGALINQFVKSWLSAWWGWRTETKSPLHSSELGMTDPHY